MANVEALRQLCSFLVGTGLGTCWLFGDGLAGPLASFFLVPLIARQGQSLGRLLVALGYYAAGSVPVAAAVVGYWGPNHAALGVAAWLGSSVLLSAPWALAARWPGAWAALALTSLPPLGVIGWLSPLNAAGVLFPGLNGVGLGLLLLCFAAVYCRRLRPPIAMLALILGIALASNRIHVEPAPPRGWIGVHTRLAPSGGSPLRTIYNNQSVIDAGLMQGEGARVLVFPEAVLDDWWPGTRQQLALAAAADQLWILGADIDSSDAVVRVTRGHAVEQPIARSAGLILGGNWIPWSRHTLRPTWWESVFSVDGRRAWAALCVEQLQPWTWLEALLQRPEVILAMSNGWWASEPDGTPHGVATVGLAIERASSRSWARLMGLPIVWADNR